MTIEQTTKQWLQVLAARKKEVTTIADGVFAPYGYALDSVYIPSSVEKAGSGIVQSAAAFLLQRFALGRMCAIMDVWETWFG